MEMVNPRLQVSEFVALTNQTLEYAYPSVEVEGEVASFKVNQNKYVFFNIKDESASVGCFMTVWQLRMPIEDGMKVIVTATPKLTNWGKFSLTVQAIRPSGEGSLKKSFELLKAKLEKEGLFSDERKRPLPELPKHIAVISSTGAAGYADFIKILNDRFGGIQVDVAHVQVQGDGAADQVIKAIRYFNMLEHMPEVLVLVRGGGSADDLSTFNDEQLVREIAASRVPVLTGIGHEVDQSLSDLAADVSAATPSNAAQLLVPDRRELQAQVSYMVSSLVPAMTRHLQESKQDITNTLDQIQARIEARIADTRSEASMLARIVAEFDPERVLARGYSLVRGQIRVGSSIEIESAKQIINAEVTDVKAK